MTQVELGPSLIFASIFIPTIISYNRKMSSVLAISPPPSLIVIVSIECSLIIQIR